MLKAKYAWDFITIRIAWHPNLKSKLHIKLQVIFKYYFLYYLEIEGEILHSLISNFTPSEKGKYNPCF